MKKSTVFRELWDCSFYFPFERSYGGLGNFIEILELMISHVRPEWEDISYQAQDEYVKHELIARAGLGRLCFYFRHLLLLSIITLGFLNLKAVGFLHLPLSYKI